MRSGRAPAYRSSDDGKEHGKVSRHLKYLSVPSPDCHILVSYFHREGNDALGGVPPHPAFLCRPFSSSPMGCHFDRACDQPPLLRKYVPAIRAIPCVNLSVA